MKCSLPASLASTCRCKHSSDSQHCDRQQSTQVSRAQRSVARSKQAAICCKSIPAAPTKDPRPSCVPDPCGLRQPSRCLVLPYDRHRQLIAARRRHNFCPDSLRRSCLLHQLIWEMTLQVWRWWAPVLGRQNIGNGPLVAKEDWQNTSYM